MSAPRPTRRRDWTSLSESTRRRYERAGINQTFYELGVPLQHARGHARTPEHPERVSRDPQRYRGYLVGKGQGGLRVISTQGVMDVTGLSARRRSLVARHENAVKRYLNRGDESGLAAFEGIEVAPGVELESRTNALDWLALRGQLSFESLYQGTG
jgi:hypothetical protein